MFVSNANIPCIAIAIPPHKKPFLPEKKTFLNDKMAFMPFFKCHFVIGSILNRLLIRSFDDGFFIGDEANTRYLRYHNVPVLKFERILKKPV